MNIDITHYLNLYLQGLATLTTYADDISVNSYSLRMVSLLQLKVHHAAVIPLLGHIIQMILFYQLMTTNKGYMIMIMLVATKMYSVFACKIILVAQDIVTYAVPIKAAKQAFIPVCLMIPNQLTYPLATMTRMRGGSNPSVKSCECLFTYIRNICS